MPLPQIFAWMNIKGERSLYDENKAVVQEANVNNFHYLTMSVMIVMLVVSVIGILIGYGSLYVSFYMGTGVVTTVCFLIFRIKSPKVRKFSLPIVYFVVAVFYLLGIFTSIYSPKGEPHVCVTFTCLLIIMPMLYLDVSPRINIFTSLFFIAHAVLAFVFKSRNMAVMDLLDTSVFLFFGVILGGYFRYIRMESFKKDKILIKQRDTDFLTGLSNRRVLFNRMEELQGETGKKINIVMIDIDFFKRYNDSYGHQAGDACLISLGALLEDFGKKREILFCRYGGEEFTGVGTGISETDFGAMVDELRLEVQRMSIPFENGVNGSISISAGYSTTTITPGVAPEKLIKLADIALYKAKNAGRNCVISAQ